MELLNTFIVAWSLLLAAQAVYSLGLMLYAWEDREKHQQNHASKDFEPPQHTFTILLPARHEEDVIQETIQRTVDLRYPRSLVQVLVIVEAEDLGTIAQVNEKLTRLRSAGIDNVELLTFRDRPINKPHGLNIGLRRATGEIVTIFDAEDEPHPNILQLVNTVMIRESAPVIQCGVQLMNYADHWFSALNVLEYFFWFKSRMHYHAAVGMAPLGGNTVFIQRRLIEELGGWDEQCLTEDADIGIRLSAMRVPIRIIYDDDYVTREETPHSIGQFVKQRTRWHQGFLQVLLKGDWRRLPTRPQRLFALYTLGFPILHALMMLYVPVSLWMMVAVKLPEAVAMISLLPAYMVAIQYIVTVIGLYEFTSAHHLRPSLSAPVRLAIAFLPYQWLLSFGALRATWRQIRGVNNWEKTAHTGAHRIGPDAIAAGRRRTAPSQRDQYASLVASETKGPVE